MPLTYSPRKQVAPFLKLLEETRRPEEQMQIMKEALESLADGLSVEFQRVATSNNSAGGVKAGFRVADTNTMVASVDATVALDVTAGNRAGTLTLAREYPGLKVTGIQYAGANVATFEPRGSDTIDGVAGPYTLSTTPVTFQADAVNNNWIIVGN